MPPQRSSDLIVRENRRQLHDISMYSSAHCRSGGLNQLSSNYQPSAPGEQPENRADHLEALYYPPSCLRINMYLGAYILRSLNRISCSTHLTWSSKLVHSDVVTDGATQHESPRWRRAREALIGVMTTYAGRGVNVRCPAVFSRTRKVLVQSYVIGRCACCCAASQL